ncbi:MAG: hypothetical protein K2X81_11175 [Candidatus Obscuribacterales bacterium]|nr:hypothetical protein [Candidatus Obscuribacterales bacterium]
MRFRTIKLFQVWTLIFLISLFSGSCVVCHADGEEQSRNPQITFKVDPLYVVYHILVNTSPDRFIGNKCRPDIVDFQNLAWEKDQAAYKFLQHGVDPYMIMDHDDLSKLGKRAQDLLQVMANDPSFKPLHKETEEAMQKAKREWDEDFEKSSSIMRELTGIKFDEFKDIQVYISHPSQKNGLGGLKIQWTYRQDFPHYNTVYLWHEILHSYIPSSEHGEGFVNAEHAVIELLADNELRCRLNGGAYPPFEGHKGIGSLREKLLPSWREYLKNPHKDIRQYLAKAKEILG